MRFPIEPATGLGARAVIDGGWNSFEKYASTSHKYCVNRFICFAIAR